MCIACFSFLPVCFHWLGIRSCGLSIFPRTAWPPSRGRYTRQWKDLGHAVNRFIGRRRFPRSSYYTLGNSRDRASCLQPLSASASDRSSAVFRYAVASCSSSIGSLRSQWMAHHSHGQRKGVMYKVRRVSPGSSCRACAWGLLDCTGWPC